MPFIPRVPLDVIETLFANAAGIALITFTSSTLTVRSFAAKNGYDIDADREMAAIGAANIAAALSQGFAVAGADSRTAMNDAAGGRTQVAGLVSAAAIALVLIFLTGPLRYVPIPALGAVLIMAAWSLVDVVAVRNLWHDDRGEFAICIISTLGVVAVGSIHAIMFAVVLALLRFVRIVARPRWEILGTVKELPGFHGVERHADAQTVPGLCLFRFNSPIVFFNAPYFKFSALKAATAAGSGLKWFVIDAVPITATDVTGRYAVRELEQELHRRGARLVVAGRQTELISWRRSKGVKQGWSDSVLDFPTLRQALRAFQREAGIHES
jgi:MFS superfamily sulfate permease-like transporter